MKKILVPQITTIPLMLLVFFALPDFMFGQAGQTIPYSASTTVTVPGCVTSITVEAWGGGGGGGKDAANQGAAGAGGGGGGAYARVNNYTVNPGQTISIIVGLGGIGATVSPNSGTNGADSWIEYASTIICSADGGNGGGGGSSGIGGTGGTIINSVGDIKFSGGNGATGAKTTRDYGGGGGGSAGPNNDGGAGGVPIGAIAVPEGGFGGNGGADGPGSIASPGPGGGGGGGEYGGLAGYNGGNGANGQVRITFNYAIPPTCTSPATTPINYCQNATATPLSVTGTAGSGTISSYAWYSNTTQSNSGGTLLETHTTTETTDTYTPLTSTPGTLYYYVLITNSNGCTAISDVSGAVTVNIDGIWTGAGDNSTWEDPLNWCGGVPTTGNVTIPVGASVHITASPVSPSTCTNLVINGTLTIDAGKALTITDILTNNGNLILSPYNNNTPENLDDDGIASLIAGTYADAGLETIGLHLPGGSWHYISTPISNLTTDIFAVGNDLAQYVEIRPTSEEPFSFQRGWIAWDGWSYFDYPANVTFPALSFSSLTLGKGYNYWNSVDADFTLSGSINTIGPALSLSNSGDATYSGYNLIGNPFTCGLNIQAMFDGAWPSGVNAAVYFTSGNTQYVFGNDVTVPYTDQSLIPPMQGFFVRATATGTYNLPWVKAHTSAPRFKGEVKSNIALVRLSISANDKSEETVIRFDEKAKSGSDTEFDAPRIFGSEGSPSIYTTLDGVDYTINGLPFPETSVEIPITVKLLSNGNHVITAMEIQELANYKVSLKDKTNGSVTDLNSVKEYSFSAPAGEIKDRFILAITNLSTDIEDPLAAEKLFNLYHGFGLINIQPLSDEWDGVSGSVKIMDLSGKPVRVEPNAEFNKNTLIQLPAPDKAGLYFVEIRSGMMKFTGKVLVK